MKFYTYKELESNIAYNFSNSLAGFPDLDNELFKCYDCNIHRFYIINLSTDSQHVFIELKCSICKTNRIRDVRYPIGALVAKDTHSKKVIV